MNNTLRQDIASVLNQHSRENGSNTPDWILAEYLILCMDAFDGATKARRAWYGFELEYPGCAKVKDLPTITFDQALAECGTTTLAQAIHWRDASNAEGIPTPYLDAMIEREKAKPSDTYRCPDCGYTQEDAALHMDHSICEAKGGPPMPGEKN